MSRFNTNNPTTSVENIAGGQAFSMTPEMELLHAVLTTFLDDKFYESGNKRSERLNSLVKKVDPEFTARLAVVARKEFHMRTVTHILVNYLAQNHRGDDLVKRTIVALTERPDDLTEIASSFIVNQKKSLPKQVKRGIRNALLKFDRYQLGKYRQEGKKVSLVDLFNLVHPKVIHASTEQRQAWLDLINGNLKSEGTWEREISGAKTKEEKRESWEKLVKSGKIGYMALLRNLNNLIGGDVDIGTLAIAAERLADPQEVKKSKQLPFRFYTAWKNVSGNRTLKNAIADAMEVSVANAPLFEGRTLVSIDCSGSMMGQPKEIAAIFGAIIAKRNDADLILYGTSVKSVEISSRSSVVDIVDKIRNVRLGGTETALTFKYAKDKKYDRIVILSDNESWVEGYYRGEGVNKALLDYKKLSGADPYIYAIDIQGYGTKDISTPKVFHLSGWSDKILDFMSLVEKGESLIKYIKNYKL